MPRPGKTFAQDRACAGALQTIQVFAGEWLWQFTEKHFCFIEVNNVGRHIRSFSANQNVLQIQIGVVNAFAVKRRNALGNNSQGTLEPQAFRKAGL